MPNGARFYVDMGHPEYCTPETSNPRDLVIADKAGERIVESAAKKLEGVSIYKNNSDGQGNSYGCHENYLIKRRSSSDFEGELTDLILPFFVTRQIFTGSGKIGIEEENDFRSYTRYDNYGSLRKEENIISQSWKKYQRERDKIIESLDSITNYFNDVPEFK